MATDLTPAALAVITRLAADLAFQRHMHERLHQRYRDQHDDLTAVLEQRRRIRAVVSANGGEAVGTEAAGFAAGRRLVNKQVLAILDQETT